MQSLLNLPARRRLLIGAAAIAVVAAAGLAAMALFPGRVQTSASRVNVLSGHGIAVGGYDVVAYFVEGRPMPGRSELAAERDGARWLFANAEHKRLFESDPERYLPAYGGYCAFGVARGTLVKIDPDAWTIDNGRLYLNYDRGVREQWLRDVPGFVAKANAAWPKLTRTDSP
jgi:YHS domain-containing protein